MKRDMSLVRDILLEIELSDVAPNSDNMEIEGHNAAERDYHIQLMHEADLIEGVDGTTLAGYSLMRIRLTWSGHDFLDAIRDDSIWFGVGKRLKDTGGSATFEVVKALAVELGKEALGLSGPK